MAPTKDRVHRPAVRTAVVPQQHPSLELRPRQNPPDMARRRPPLPRDTRLVQRRPALLLRLGGGRGQPQRGAGGDRHGRYGASRAGHRAR